MQLLKYSYSSFEKDLILFFSYVPGVGRKTIKKLLIFLKKSEPYEKDVWVLIQMFFKKYTKIKNINTKLKKSYFEQKIVTYKEDLGRSNIRVIFFTDEKYPVMLQQSPDFPLMLFYKGDVGALQKSLLAVVGTRNNTGYGNSVVNSLVPDLVLHGFSIVSGGMYGIDLLSHKACLKSRGETIVVLGYGFSHVPRYLTDVCREIMQSGLGCIVTEYPPHVPPSKGTFPERNRVVAGLSRGVLVIEAASQSGTHITVDCALDSGREVFAVPGSIFNPYSEGTKTLLNQGAHMVTSVSDILENLQLDTIIPVSDQRQSDLEQQILQQLRESKATADKLSLQLGISASELLTELCILELSNKIVKDDEYWRLVLS